jgi:sialic acid synthase SpsE
MIINNTKIGVGCTPYIFAEMSANHNAYKIIDMAKACGADAVKLQTYTADTGYVGLSNTMLLSQNHEVIALDIILEKIEQLNNKISPIVDDDVEEFCFVV